MTDRPIIVTARKPRPAAALKVAKGPPTCGSIVTAHKPRRLPGPFLRRGAEQVRPVNPNAEAELQAFLARVVRPL